MISLSCSPVLIDLYITSLVLTCCLGGRCSLLNSTAAKILHLIIFGILLPCLCICIPVYAKYVLYADSVITLGASDMRLVDGHVSTTWCKVLSSNVYFFPLSFSQNNDVLLFELTESKYSNEHFV